ncbi:Homocysteine S-methyltransferase 1 [Rhizopus stolonifer]|uniref:Homocysteine S-methyltransferase 1 n=1 Tax=Rhizopus stolonifer TaxID=4846 RepID=A0A367KTG2_RHIST|nr:Homocysteine S-methyltransferase 1 [Rhizopus stolonifer]
MWTCSVSEHSACSLARYIQFSLLSCLITFSFLCDAIVIVLRVVDKEKLPVMLVYYTALSWVAWIVSLVCLMDESHKFSKWYWIQYLYFAAAVIADTVLAWFWAVGFYKHSTDNAFHLYDFVLLGIFITRYTFEFFTFCFSIIQLLYTTRHIPASEPLLSSQPNYGSIEQDLSTGKEKEENGFWSKFVRVLPFIWPRQFKLQQLVILCFLLMLLGLVINVYTPLQIGYVVDQFNRDPQTFAWVAVCAYVGFKFLQGSSGVIQALQNYLWIPVGQYTTREISVKLFAHLHSLSLHFHINRKTGEVLRVVDRGTNSIVQLLSQIVFQIFPALANILVAVVVFSVQFSIPFGAIVFVTMALYMYTTITLTEWRTSFRRKMNELDNFARTKAVDSLLNFETVKYYNAESFEVNRYDQSIAEYQKADYKNSASLNILNLAQNAVITGGLLAGSLLFAYEVSEGRLTAGNFVTFNIYMMQLYTPLHWFGTYYRMIQQNFIDMEKMFDLFDVEETVKDVEGAGELQVTEGHVVFDRVSFSYDQRQTALNSISFSIPKGATVALVGPSGGGKSTILRLLFRFYDPDSGRVVIDGQDIAKVQQTSLRKNIGVVPQDTVLFNDTIMYNIRYGNVNASDEDVMNAAKAAQIHDKILSFPDGYETKVGERGLRLSGGEKQRVAIARTILKDPSIILLDEATSALDTTTERYIQEALAEMTKDRTTLVIAHRLSTIVNADLILVIKDGRVVESGSHDELIQSALANTNEGVYYEMWQKQLDDHTAQESTDEPETIQVDEENTKEPEALNITAKPVQITQEPETIELESQPETTEDQQEDQQETQPETIELEASPETQEEAQPEKSTDEDTKDAQTSEKTTKRNKKNKRRKRTKSNK